MGNCIHCPRCGEKTLERMTSYSHCPNCFFYEDYWRGPDSDLIEAERFLRDLETNEVASDVDDGAEILDFEFLKNPEVEPSGGRITWTHQCCRSGQAKISTWAQ